MKQIFLASIFICIISGLQAQTITLPASTVRDKIRGGLLGQMLGNLNGIPHEHRYIMEPGSVEQYVPALPDGAWTDDDTDFEWVYILNMQREREPLLPYSAIAALWKERINRNIWCSNRFARHLMDMGFQPPQTGNELLNPWAGFNVSGQFLCETFGLLAPGMPVTAAETGLHYTRAAIGGEPAQTTQLFTAMIATAFVERDLSRILAAGTAAVDPRSNTFRLIDSVKVWHKQHPGDWKAARMLLRDRFTRENGGMRDKNGTELNTGAILLAWLYGQGDFAGTLRLAFNMGWDADCNAATLGTILGALHGYRHMMAQGWKITDRYKNTSRDNMPMDETITSFSDRLIDLFERINEKNGGQKTILHNESVYRIVRQEPSPVLKIKSFGELRQEMLEEYPVTRLVRSMTDGTREEKARAAYMTICLGLQEQISLAHADVWREAAYSLSGYWKVIHNIFSDGFNDMAVFREKFTAAGFRQLKMKYTDEDIYADAVFWKRPETLY